MFKNMTVGAKIAMGFGFLLLVTVALGGVGVWNMTELSNEAGQVSGDYLPQARIFNQIQLKSIEAMAHHRRFMVSSDDKDYQRGQQSVGELNKLFTRARTLAARSLVLGRLRGVIDQAAAKLKQYEKVAAKGRKTKQNLSQVQQEIDRALQGYLAASERYLAIEGELLRKDIEGQGAPERALVRLGNIERAKTFFRLGDQLNALVMKSALRRSPGPLDQAHELSAKISRMVASLRASSQDDRSRQTLDQVEKTITGLDTDLGRLRAVWTRMRGVEQEQVKLAGAIVAAAQANLTSALKEVEAISGETKSMQHMMFIGLGLALLLGLLLAWSITRSITKPLARIILGLRDGSQQVAAASDQVSTSSQQLAGGASQQAASLEETSASLEEITSMTRANADNAGQADTLMSEVKRAVKEADRDMNQMATSLDRIAKLGDETGKIIKAIDEIAFQTNLLALNAAVEAARAGEAGAGFAVVADEVRNLAMRAAEAAKGTQGLIEEMVSGIEQSSQMMGRTVGGFEQVAQAANKVAELVSEIAVASGEQAQGVDQINLAVNELDRVTQSNAANAEQGAAAAEEMNAMAMSTHDLVDGLSAMVGAAGGNRRPPADRETKALAKKMIPFQGKQRQEAAQAAGPDPRAVIPLEQEEGAEDFVDF